MRSTLAVAAVLLGCAPPPGAAPAMPVPVSACLVADTTAPTRDTIRVIGLQPARPGSTDCEGRQISVSNSPVIVDLVPATGTDLRDALDRDPKPGVIVTRDPELLAYAASRAEYFIRTLPWDRTYVLLVADSTLSIPHDAEREALARDAVRADVRGAVPPFAWRSNTSCVASSATPRPLIAYTAGDAIARQLAERIVALAGGGERPAWVPIMSGTPRIASLDSDSAASVIAAGRTVAAVIALPRGARDVCGIPLVDSRAHVIVRRGSGAAFTIGADGSLYFTRPGAP